MQKTLSIMCMLVLICFLQNSYAALTATTIFEVRPTTGSNLNGGCYDDAKRGVAGSIDYTYDAPQVFSFSALTAVASTTLTDSSAQFTAAMVGNCLHLESADVGTPGYILIVGFTNSTTVTMEASRTITNGVGKLGGATASYNGQTTTTLAASLVAGNVIYHKASGETWNEAVTLAVAGSVASPIILEGYNTTRGDAPLEANRPTNARASAGATGILITGGGYLISHIVVSGAGTIGLSVTTTGSVLFHNVRATGCGAEGFKSTVTNVAFYRVESDLNTTIGISIPVALSVISKSYIHNNTTTGITASGGTQVVIEGNIIANNGSHGISFITNNALTTIIGNTIHGNGADGINNAQTFIVGSLIVNNIFSSNSTTGVNKVIAGGTNKGVWLDYNDFSANGTPRTNVFAGPHDLALAPNYTAAGSGDYSIGTNLQAQGYPGTFPAGTTIGYTDIGGVQRQNLIQVGSFLHVFP